MTEEQALEDLKERMRGQRSGDVEVIDVWTEYFPDVNFDLYVEITLILNDPAPGLRTWPLVDSRALKERARSEAAGLPITTRIGVQVGSRPSHDLDRRES